MTPVAHPTTLFRAVLTAGLSPIWRQRQEIRWEDRLMANLLSEVAWA